MSGFLRAVGVLNMAVWLGAAVFFNFSVRSAAWSPAMANLLGPRNHPYFAASIEQMVAARLFHLQLLCCVIAWLHVLAVWLYSGKALRKRWLAVLVCAVALVVFDGGWVRPKLQNMFEVRYGVNTPVNERRIATDSFSAWHEADEFANLLMIAGVAVYLWRVANPPDPTRFVSTANFRS